MKSEKDDPENQPAEVPEEITVREAGRRGGRSTLERHGIEFYRKIGLKGGLRTRELYRELFREWGRKGGRPRRPNLVDVEGERYRF